MYHSKKQLGITLAILGAIIFVICFFWGFVIAADVRELHADLLKISVLGWTGMNIGSFVLGLVQWAVWGWLAGLSLGFIGGSLYKKHGGKGGNCCKN